MFLTNENSLIFFILFVLLLLAFFCAFIIFIVYKYNQRQLKYNTTIKEINTVHKNIILQTQVEIQEQTFEHISKEIHDNIGQKLTLSKLMLNTIDFESKPNTISTIHQTVDILSDALIALSALSKSLSGDLLLEYGLPKMIDIELKKIIVTNQFKITYTANDNGTYLAPHRELILFRIFQETINNILKHAKASAIEVDLNYSITDLIITITDNGIGFSMPNKKNGNGLLNIAKRTIALQGEHQITSNNNGTTITLKIPIHDTKYSN